MSDSPIFTPPLDEQGARIIGRRNPTDTGAQSLDSQSIYVKAVSAPCTFDLGAVTDTGTYSTAACVAASTTTWNRCTHDSFTVASGGGPFFIGNASLLNGGTTRSACSVYVWRAQCEASSRTTSPMAAASTSATTSRARDTLTASITWPVGSTISGSIQVLSPSHINAADTFFMLRKDVDNYYLSNIVSTKVRAAIDIATTITTQDTAAAPAASVTNWVGMVYDATQLKSCLNGTCTGTNRTLTIPTGPSVWRIGEDVSGGGQLPDAVIKNACLDPSPTVCVTQ